MAACALGLGGCAPWLARPFAGLRGLAPGASAHPLESTRAHARGPAAPFGGARLPGCVDAGSAGTRALDPAGAMSIGPLLFLGLARRQPAARFEPRTVGGRRVVPPLPVLVVVPPDTRATIAVAPGDRSVAGLLSGAAAQRLASAADAHLALTCVAGPAQRTYAVAFVVNGPRCVPISVTARRRTTSVRVGFGVRGCSR